MELLLKLLEDANTEKSIRIICENVKTNRQYINTVCGRFFIVIILLEILNLWTMHRLDKRIQKISNSSHNANSGA